ncbi:MAG: hypothetical protein AMXMBFR56_68230 [Polyangiaceae bacterium]
MARKSKVPTPTDLARLYGAGHDALTAALDAGCLPSDLQNKWPNLLGTLRRVEGQPYHRPGLNGREDPLTDDEKRVLAWEFRKAAQQAEEALAKCRGRAANPVTEGGVALAALAAAGLAWLLLRPKKAAAATSTPVELPSFTPSSTPAPQPVSVTPKLPELNCAGKVRVTYKFKDSPLLLNVFRRLTIWKTDKSPQEPSFQEEDRIWAPTTAADLFKIGAQDAQGWVNSTKLENDVKDQQMSPLPGERYLAEAWVETTDGWCLAATSTNYEAWV